MSILSHLQVKIYGVNLSKMEGYMKKILMFLCSVLFIFLISTSVYGENTTTIICNYTNYANDDGFHKVKDKFVLTFVIDESKGVSYMIGNNGSTEVKMLLNSENGFSFIEITESGNVMTTTIDSLGNTCHSRSPIIKGKVIPSQYYGTYVTK